MTRGSPIMSDIYLLKSSTCDTLSTESEQAAIFTFAGAALARRVLGACAARVLEAVLKGLGQRCAGGHSHFIVYIHAN